ncbi:MAG TPA: DUF493 domain-containing protein [Methylococcaceae bacterium]|nr:DUF493 domain-containing protein [Methylococcaceae bacterium]
MTPEDRLELLDFPCDFPIKAFGQGGENFDLTVVEIVRRHAPNLGEGAVSVRASRGGRYQAVTVTIRATDQAQLDAIYQDLSACESVLMAL